MSARHPTDGTAVLKAIYRRHYGLVRWVLCACGVAEGALDDRAHDVFVAICRRLPERDPDVPMRAWVTGVARNVAFSHRRSMARRHRQAQQLGPPDDPPGPEEMLERREAWRALAAFLDALGPEQREVFVMVEVTGMRVSELAASTGLPANTLHSRLKAARTRFSEHFASSTEPRAELVRRARGQGRARPKQRRQTWCAIAASVEGFEALPLSLAPCAPAAKSAGLWGSSKIIAVVAVAGTLGGAAIVGTRSSDAPAARAELWAAQTPPVAASPSTSPSSPSERAITPVSDEPEPPVQTSSRSTARPPKIAASPHPRPEASPGASPAPGLVDAEFAGAVQALGRARTKLRQGHADEALVVLDAFGTRFGALGRERRRVEIDAACTLGDSSRARRAARALWKLGAAIDLAHPCQEHVD